MIYDEIVRMMEHFDGDRNVRWVKCTECINNTRIILKCNIQGLGRLDSSLIVDDNYLMNNKPFKVNPFGDLSNHYTLSYLWVLGAYELVRTLYQYSYSKDREKLNSNTVVLDKLKSEFAELRVPLAKHEKKGNKAIKVIPFPAFTYEFGTSWLISSDRYISRRELSDKMLSAFEKMDFSVFNNA